MQARSTSDSRKNKRVGDTHSKCDLTQPGKSRDGQEGELMEVLERPWVTVMMGSMPDTWERNKTDRETMLY